MFFRPLDFRVGDSPLFQHPNGVNSAIMDHLIDRLPTYADFFCRLPDSLKAASVSFSHARAV